MSQVTSILKLDYAGVQLNAELAGNIQNLRGFASNIFRGGLDTESTDYTDTKTNFSSALSDVQANLTAINNLIYPDSTRTCSCALNSPTEKEE